MRIMGIDYGDSRIGVAISDPLAWTARGVETITQKGNIVNAIERIKQIAEDYDIKKIIVGFPMNMNGTIGVRAEKTLEFIEMLRERINIEIIKWDERLSTVAANRTLRELGFKVSRKRDVVDQVAAVYILQGYLDSIRTFNS